MKIKMGDTEVKQVESILYLGSIINGHGSSEKEIVKRVGLAKKVFSDVDKMLKNLSMNMKARVRLLNCKSCYTDVRHGRLGRT